VWGVWGGGGVVGGWDYDGAGGGTRNPSSQRSEASTGLELPQRTLHVKATATREEWTDIMRGEGGDGVTFSKICPTK